ncbi:MAG: CHAP domain-containing protein [Clostridia bacterium]|nr:CHAP domain-containing protein [Clostridia bacterium]
MKRVKRLSAFLLCLIVILSITTLNIPVLAASNPYPSSQTISGVTTVPCTRYAWQQVYDRLGIALPNWGNAINWLDKAANNGYSTGSVAQVNSIAVWRSSAHSYGHVSFVTAVNGNSMTINEGGMTIDNKPANGTGIITGASASSVVGTKKNSYSSCTLLGFIYLTKADSGSSPVTTVTIKNTGVDNITSSNAFLKSVINKPKSYAVQRVGVKIRREGKTYTEEWKFHKQDAAKAWTDYAEVELTWNLSSECGYSLIHATKYYYKMYAVINGTEYWSDENSFTTAGSHSYSNACDTSCNTCGVTRKVSHNFASATCESPKKCKVCGEISGSALGHTYTNGCDVDCNRCGDIRLIAHSYIDATCTKAATCKVCGCTYGKSLGHSYKTTTTKATLSKNGSIVKKCTVCGKVASKSTIKYAKTFKLSATSYTYNGKVKTPIVTVKDSAGNKLKKNVDYTLSSSSGRKNVGTYKVTIKMKGKYSGTKTLTFKINPAKTNVSKLTAGKKSITVNISKKSTQVSGYQVQYSTSKKFTSAKTKTISSYKTTKYTLKSLSAKKTYYVRVRTYKTVNGKKYYSGWSTYKYIKTK